MKTKLLSIAILASSLVSAQAWDLTGNSGTTTTNFIGTTDDKEVIFKTDNKERLRIFGGPYVNGIAIGNPTAPGARLELFSVLCAGCGSNWALPNDFVVKTRAMRNLEFLMGNNNSADPNTDTSTPNSAGITRVKFTDAVHNNTLVINNMGKVTVGTDQYDNDPNYIFYVRKGIKAEQIKVENPAANGWADYVFKKDYKLRTLEEVEKHIEEKGHLPNIPSTSEVEKDGINLGEMDAKLLEKIEELTLYSIEQNKQIKRLQEENKALRSQSEDIKELKKQVQELLSTKK